MGASSSDRAPRDLGDPLKRGGGRGAGGSIEASINLVDIPIDGIFRTKSSPLARALEDPERKAGGGKRSRPVAEVGFIKANYDR